MCENFENLINLVNNLSISSESINIKKPIENKMATPNYQFIKYQADNIPNFDGNSKQLCRFLRSCEHFLLNHQNPNTPDAPINICLFDTIIGKLKGRAADIIASRVELDSWQKVKDSLIVTFSDQRSEDCLVQDIISMKPIRNEPIQNFALRLQDARSLLCIKINNSDDLDPVKLIKIQQYDELCLKTFINNLDYHTQLVVRLKNPNSLEQAMAFVREEENFLKFKNQTIMHKPITNNQFTQRPNNTNNIFKQPNQSFNNFPKPNYNQSRFRPNFNNGYNNNNFNNNNFRPPNSFNNNNHNQNPFKRTNSGTFKTNNFTRPQFNNTFGRPFQNNPSTSKLPPVEPMDTSSGNSRISNRKPIPNFAIDNNQSNQYENDNFNQCYDEENYFEQSDEYQYDSNEYNYDPNQYQYPEYNYENYDNNENLENDQNFQITEKSEQTT